MDANRHETFDYVIVGSGAGGGTLAARLVERGFTVAVLEAGGDPRSNDKPHDPTHQQLCDHYDVPVFHAYCTENASLRWDFWVRHYGNPEQQARDTCCYKEEYDGVLYPRAGTLGGCTAHNAMITVYPHNADWDAIAEATADPSWKAENMRKYFERLEDCRHRVPYRWLAKLGINPARHGWSGWLHTEKVVPREVIEDKALVDVIFQSVRVALKQPTSLLQRTLWFLQSQGDPNDWRLVKQNSVGIRYTPLATRRHQRMGTRERLLDTAKRHPGRLRILLNALATRVLFDKDNKAVGVEYLEGEHLYHASPKASPARAGVPGQVRARLEVILCGGAFNTPQLLMLSGIGPAAELRKHGIPVRVDLPDVGQNLQDRYEVGVVNEMARPWAVLDGATFARGDPQYKEWESERSGVYATNGAVLAVVKRSTEAKPLPDLFCFALLGKFHGYFPDYSSFISKDRNCLTWAILKAHTNNRAGEVTLRSSDPRAMPDVNFKYFHEGTEDGGEDLDAVVEGIKFAREMTRELIDRGEVRREIVPGERVKSDEELRTFVRDHAWGHHASCTCAIGSVLDSEFRVHGTRGLRVVDASVFPRIPGFFIVTAVYMVAEKAADVIAAAATKGDLMDTKTTAPDELAPGEGLALERARIEERRDWLKLRECHPSPDRAWGLALSGGGIRSATFSLGVLQALASSRLRSDDAAQKRTLLHYFDYLSTVSGGGYIGAFFCSLFVPKRLQPDPPPPDKPIPMSEQMRSTFAALNQLRLDMKLDEAASRAQKEALKKQPADPSVDAANQAFETIAYDPPTRYRSSDPYDTARTPTAWLRDNGRYLAPTGAGDLFYAGTLGLRNWLSLQFVIGTVLLLLFSVISFARAGLAEVSVAYTLVEFSAMFRSLKGIAPVWGEIWWSPLLAVPVLLVPVLLAIGVAFWLAHWMPHQEKRNLPVSTFTTAVVVAGFLAGGLVALASRLETLHRGTPVSVGLQVTAGIIAFAIVLHLFGRRGRNVPEQRVATTRWLATWLQLTLVAALIGIVDTAGQTLYRELTDPEAGIWMALSPAGLLAGLIWVVRHFAASAGEKKKDKLSIPLGWVTGAAGLLMLALVATGWQLLVQWVQWHGAAPDPNAIVQMGRYGTLGWLAIAALVLAITVGKFASFINVSSLQSFYSARLVRAFLGASNGSRFTSADAAQCSVAEPHENDELTHDKYYAPEVLAPLHIINVTVNQTLNRGEQLVQRDRKGKPLAILPHGFSLDGWHNRLRERRAWHEIQLPLSIGNWIGTSGAAFSTGIGRATSLSSSLALGLANVRLGTWWESGLGRKSSKAISRFGEMFFTSQTYLAYELLGQFHGTRRRWQYLSDGGHFENTALFELLRKDKAGDRGVKFMVCCDSGCDPKYQFNDLANLIRLARIDFRAEIEVDTKIAEHPQLGHRFGTVAEFSGEKAVATKCAILLKVRYAPVAPDAPAEKVIVLLKPRVIPGVPVDIGEYKATHKEFPQETTADQFFDEAQWEGYRKLGRAIAEEIFGAEKCGPHLWTYLAEEHGIRVVNPVAPAPAPAGVPQPGK